MEKKTSADEEENPFIPKRRLAEWQPDKDQIRQCLGQPTQLQQLMIDTLIKVVKGSK